MYRSTLKNRAVRQSLVSAAYGPHSSHILKKGLLLHPPPVQPNLPVCFISALLASHFCSSESAKERRLGFSHAKSFLKDWQMQIQLQGWKHRCPLVMIKRLGRMWLGPATGGQTSAVNHTEQVKSLQHLVPPWLIENPTVWPRCEVNFWKSPELFYVRKRWRQSWRKKRPPLDTQW